MEAANATQCDGCPSGMLLSDNRTDASLHDSIEDCTVCDAGMFYLQVSVVRIRACGGDRRTQDAHAPAAAFLQRREVHELYGHG